MTYITQEKRLGDIGGTDALQGLMKNIFASVIDHLGTQTENGISPVVSPAAGKEHPNLFAIKELTPLKGY